MPIDSPGSHACGYRYYTPTINGSPELVRQSIEKELRKLHLSVDRLLDLGGGDGSFTYRVASIVRANLCCVVDVNKVALKEAQKRGFSTYMLNLNYEELTFPSDYFDLALAVEVIEHLLTPDILMKEAFRVLKSGGYLIISTPNLAYILNRIVLLLGYQPYFSETSCIVNAGKLVRARNRLVREPSKHLKMYTLRSLKDILEFYGFRIKIVRGIYLPSHSILMKIFQNAPSLAPAIMVVAQKPPT